MIVFLIFSLNIYCGYMLEPPHASMYVNTISVFEQTEENNVYPCKPQFYHIEVRCKGVTFTQACYPDVELTVSNLLLCKAAYHLKHFQENQSNVTSFAQVSL